MRVIKMALIQVGMLLLWAGIASAQQLPKCQPWIGIKSWQISIHVNGSGTNTDPVTGASASLQESDDIQFQLTIDPGFSALCTGTWGWGTVQSPKESIHINGSTFSGGGASGCTDDFSYSRTNIVGGGGGLDMDFVKGTYYAGFGVVIGPTGNGDYWDSENYSGNCVPIQHQFYESGIISYDPTCVGYDPSLLGLINGALPGGGALSGSASYTCPAQALSVPASLNKISWTITWSMTPTPVNLELVVTIPAYNTWRPTAQSTEQQVGLTSDASSLNTLNIQAQLIDKDSGTPTYLIPDTVTFILANVSREPGVAMNWPQTSATEDPDLTFDCGLNVGLGVTKVDSTDCEQNPTFTGTTVEFQPEDNSSPLVATVSPHDWGAWTTLNVTAAIAGVEIQGSLISDPGNKDIRIPQRQEGSFIADSWKIAHEIPLDTPDSDDSEKSAGDNSYPGDGLTLYEEYRGFYVGCPQFQSIGATCIGGIVHREGDPQRKDLFIINETQSALVDKSIKIFGSSTGLNLCCRTLKDQHIRSDRVINFNSGQGPHEVDQHALLVKWAPDAATKSCVDKGPGTPKVVNNIYIQSFTSIIDGATSFGMDPVSEFVATVEHEIGHAVAIWHHGEADTPSGGYDGYVYWYTPDGITLKEIGKVTDSSFVDTLQRAGSGKVIHVFAEPGPTDVTAAWVNKLNGQSAYPTWQGVNGGQNSGDVRCFMRYDNATNYISLADSGVRYVAIEQQGLALTDNPLGTETNASRVPQPRYFDSAAGRGRCQSNLCVNDALNPSGPVGTCKF